MYIRNLNTDSITTKDMDLLLDVCIALKVLPYIQARQTGLIPKWPFHLVECHSVSRFISLSCKDLTLVDGYLIGLVPVPNENRAEIIYTCHSWLMTPDGAIIDPCPMGIISTNRALLLPINNIYTVHGSNLYQKNPDVLKEFDVTESWRIARSILRTMKKHALKEDIGGIAQSIF